MEFTTQEKTKDLKPYPFNEEIFGLLEKSDYEALKQDIQKNGVKVELHILPDKTVICGHQRLMIAKELGIDHLRCKIVSGLDTPDQIKEYVIIDNLLRRQLTIEKRSFLELELYLMKEKKQGKRTDLTLSQNETKLDLYQEIADQQKISRSQVARDITYARAVKNNPDLKNKKMSEVLQIEKHKKRKEKMELLSNDYKEDGSIEVIINDFRKVDVTADSIDLIVTDPPYPQEFLGLWKDLGAFAERVLKPGGFLVVYSGVLHLPEVFANLSYENLKYYWSYAYLFTKTDLTLARNIINEWKPILIYQKLPFQKVSKTLRDKIDFDVPDKTLHKWQQGEKAFEYFIENFSNPNDMVCDPFTGSGTVPLCCKRLKRKCIAIEIDKECEKIIKGRLSDVDNEQQIE